MTDVPQWAMDEARQQLFDLGLTVCTCLHPAWCSEASHRSAQDVADLARTLRAAYKRGLHDAAEVAEVRRTEAFRALDTHEDSHDRAIVDGEVYALARIVDELRHMAKERE